MLQESGTDQSEDDSFDDSPMDFKMFHRPPDKLLSNDGEVVVLTKENDVLRNNSQVFLSLADAHKYMENNVRTIVKSPRIFISTSEKQTLRLFITSSEISLKPSLLAL